MANAMDELFTSDKFPSLEVDQGKVTPFFGSGKNAARSRRDNTILAPIHLLCR
jgi:hypothetical protein